MPVQANYQETRHVELEASSCPDFINFIVSLAEKASSSSGLTFCGLAIFSFDTSTLHDIVSKAESSWNRHSASFPLFLLGLLP